MHVGSIKRFKSSSMRLRHPRLVAEVADMHNPSSAATGENVGAKNERTCRNCPLVRELEVDNGDGIALYEYYCRYHERSVTLRSGCDLSVLVIDHAANARAERLLQMRDEDDSTDVVTNFSVVVRMSKKTFACHIEQTPRGDSLSNRPYIVQATKSDDVPACEIVPDPNGFTTHRNGYVSHNGVGVLRLSDETLDRLRDGTWTKDEASPWVKHANKLRAAKKYDVDLRRYAPARDVAPIALKPAPSERPRTGPVVDKLISDNDAETLAFWTNYAERVAARRAAKAAAASTGKTRRSLRRAERKATAALLTMQSIPCAATEASA